MPGSREVRETAYERLLGREFGFVYHETEPRTPHVDVYVFAPAEDDDFFTLITGGMSDLRMTVPDPESFAMRAELVMYVRRPDHDLVDILRQLAHFPHDNATWFGWGHTIPWRGPIAPGSQLDTILLATAELDWEDESKRLTVDGDPVMLYQATAITADECALKLRRGAGALMDLLIERGASLVVEPERESYVSQDELPEPFPFAESPDTGVVTTRDIMEGKAPILLVCHEPDGDWQFMPGTDVESGDLVLVHLSHIVDGHPDVRELAGLPLGWDAERASPSEAWEWLDFSDVPRD